MTTKPRRNDRLDVHVTVAEKQVVRLLAAKRNVSLSSFVRQCIGTALRAEQDREQMLRATYPHKERGAP